MELEMVIMGAMEEMVVMALLVEMVEKVDLYQ